MEETTIGLFETEKIESVELSLMPIKDLIFLRFPVITAALFLKILLY